MAKGKYSKGWNLFSAPWVLSGIKWKVFRSATITKTGCQGSRIADADAADFRHAV